LWPVLTGGLIVGMESYRRVLAIILIPWFITGATILFPLPALALDSANRQASKVAINLSKISATITKACFVPDLGDVYLTETDILYSTVLSDLSYIKEMTSSISAEVSLFWWLYPEGEVLVMFVDFASKIVSELKELQEAAAELIQNEVIYYLHVYL